MAKINKEKGEAPIEFEIPTGWNAIEGGRLPIPVNQPNWKYKKPALSKPRAVDWILVISFLMFSLFISIFAISYSNSLIGGIFLGTIFAIGSVLLLARTIIQVRNYNLQQKAGEEERTRKTNKAKSPGKRNDW